MRLIAQWVKMGFLVFVLWLAAVSASSQQTAWTLRQLLEAQFFDVQHAAAHLDQDLVRLHGDGGRHTYTWEVSKGSDVEVETKFFHFHSSIDIQSADQGHFLRTVNLSFTFPFYGREVSSVLVSSAGALLMGDPMDKLPLPSFVAPFFTKMNSGNDLVRFTDTGSSLVVEWREKRPFNVADLPELVFQTELREDGSIVFVYQNILDKLIEAARRTGYPIIVGLQDSFGRPSFRDGRVMDFYMYPGLSIPPSDLAVNQSSEWVRVELSPDLQRSCSSILTPTSCINGCEWCSDKCVSTIETSRVDKCEKDLDEKQGSDDECPSTCPIEVNRESVVCGTDGINYSSLCELRWIACAFNHTNDLQHAGVCHHDLDDGDHSPTEDEDRTEDEDLTDDLDADGEADVCDAVCDSSLSPVCVDSKSVYINECVMRLTSCRLNVEMKSHLPGLCERRGTSTRCPGPCPSDHAPVCASNGLTYNNECLLRQLICHNNLKELKMVREGACLDADNSQAFALVNCIPMHESVCSNIVNPVCASDGNTYDNLCALNARIVCSHSEEEKVIEVVHLGNCATPALDHSHLSFHSSSTMTKVIKGFIFVSVGVGIGLMATALFKVYRNYNGWHTRRGPQLSFDLEEDDNNNNNAVVTISRETESKPTNVPDRSKYDRLVLDNNE